MEHIEETIEVGDVALVRFVVDPPVDGCVGERMWVRVEGILPDCLTGVLDNEPVVRTDLRCGQRVDFEPEAILDTIPAGVAHKALLRTGTGPERRWSEDFGPPEIGAMLGVCIGLYISHEVSREDLIEMTGDMYDDIVKAADAHKKREEAEWNFFGKGKKNKK